MRLSCVKAWQYKYYICCNAGVNLWSASNTQVLQACPILWSIISNRKGKSVHEKHIIIEWFRLGGTSGNLWSQRGASIKRGQAAPGPAHSFECLCEWILQTNLDILVWFVAIPTVCFFSLLSVWHFHFCSLRVNRTSLRRVWTFSPLWYRKTIPPFQALQAIPSFHPFLQSCFPLTAAAFFYPRCRT